MTVVIPNSQQVSLRDALEVVPFFDGSYVSLSHFIEGCMEAKAMRPTPAAQENLARLSKENYLEKIENAFLDQLMQQ